MRALETSRTAVESLDRSAEQLRHIQKAFKRAGEQARERTAQYTEPGVSDGPLWPVDADGRQVHGLRQPGPGSHCGPGAGY